MTSPQPQARDELEAALRSYAAKIEPQPDGSEWRDHLNKVLPSLLFEAASTLTAQARELEVMRGALEEIVNPLAALSRRAEENGRRLSGQAYSIANSVSYLQGIARAALNSGGAG